MLRIRVEDRPEATTLYIEGKLVGDSVDELRRVWTDCHLKSTRKQTILELSSVQVVDNGGYKLLRQMHEWGTTLAGGGLMISSLIDEITGASRTRAP